MKQKKKEENMLQSLVINPSRIILALRPDRQLVDNWPKVPVNFCFLSIRKIGSNGGAIWTICSKLIVGHTNRELVSDQYEHVFVYVWTSVCVCADFVSIILSFKRSVQSCSVDV